MRTALKNILVAGCWKALGRRNLIRLAGFLLDEARLDVHNDMDLNGEWMVQDRFLECVPNNRTIIAFDVGAHVGKWTLGMLEKSSRYNLEVEVYAFEPSRQSYAILRKNVSMSPLRDRVQLVNMGLSDQTRSADFFYTSPTAGCNSIHKNYKMPVGSYSELANFITVDDYCSSRSLAHIDLLKCDVEGHEFAVLRGASGLLMAHAIDLIQFEYSFRWINARHFLKDAFDFLIPLGYQIGKVTPQGIEFYEEWQPELESFKEGNYLACRGGLWDSFPKVRWWNGDGGTSSIRF